MTLEKVCSNPVEDSRFDRAAARSNELEAELSNNQRVDDINSNRQGN